MPAKFEELKALLKRAKTARNEHTKFIENFILQMGLRAIAKTKFRTPVDSGFLRNSWQIGEVKRRDDILIVEIINNAEYASYVENGYYRRARWVPGEWKGGKFVYKKYIPGSSDNKGMMLKPKWVEGVHMAKISIDEIGDEIPIRFKRAYDKWISEVMFE